MGNNYDIYSLSFASRDESCMLTIVFLPKVVYLHPTHLHPKLYLICRNGLLVTYTRRP